MSLDDVGEGVSWSLYSHFTVAVEGLSDVFPDFTGVKRVGVDGIS